METYVAAFSTWKSVHARLEHTIQDYLDACVTLRDVCSVPPSSPSSRQYVERRLFEVDRELHSFPRCIQALKKSRHCLSAARNTSQILSPITMLPSDVLHLILSLTTRSEVFPLGPCAGRLRMVPIVALSGVCSVWRRLMLSCPTFWTSPDLVLKGTASKSYYKLARLWVRRSQDMTLDLLVYEKEDCTWPKRTLRDWNTDVVANLLITLLPRVRTLRFCTHSLLVDKNALHRTLDYWATHGTTGRAERLVVWDNTNFDADESSESTTPDTYTSIDPIAFINFFSSLRHLFVRDAWNDLSKLVHVGLVELRIEYVAHWFPTIQDLRDIVAAAPCLRILVLDAVLLSRSSEELDMVSLHHLETLIVDGYGLWPLLNVLVSDSPSIQVSLTLDDVQWLPMIHSFLSRNNISHLCLQNSGMSEPTLIANVLHALPQMPHLRALAFSRFKFNEAQQNITDMPPPDIWPALHELHLIDWKSSPQALNQLISIYLPQTLFWSNFRRLPGDVDQEPTIEEAWLGKGTRVVHIPHRLVPTVNYWDYVS